MNPQRQIILPILLTALFCLTLLCPLLAQQIKLEGTVSIHNSKYRTDTIQYVENAQISAAFSSPTNEESSGIWA